MLFKTVNAISTPISTPLDVHSMRAPCVLHVRWWMICTGLGSGRHEYVKIELHKAVGYFDSF